MKFHRLSGTQKKIIESAFILFGKYGYEGTSIRNIASKAEVNIAAVNYHFQSKENLFWHVMHETFFEVECSVEEMHQSAKTVKDLAENLFLFFSHEPTALRNTMKMLLTESVKPPTDKKILASMSASLGPPGGKYFEDLIQKEVPYAISDLGLRWAVKSIFGSIMHWALMLGSNKMCLSHKNEVLMSPAQIKLDVCWMVISTMDYLKKNKIQFKKQSSKK